MVELLRHEVRFGELSWGPSLHYATFFDLLIRATEELSHELDYAAESIVAADGVPFAPVAIHAEFDTYPRYEDTVVVTGEPASAGETNVQVDYRFSRAADDAEFGRATVVHVTITPGHTAEPVSPELRERLAALGSVSGQPTRIDPRSPSAGGADGAEGADRAEGADGPEFRREVTFRTPHIEAAGLGYFEDYAREMSIALEAFLDERGRSLGDLSGEVYPFLPVGWDLTIERSIAFEDAVEVVGRFVEADEEAVVVAYEFRRAGTDEVCIRAALTYGCFDDDGDRVAFPAEAIEAVGGG